MDRVQLIINGDDFGKSPEVNEAVIRAFRAGTLTSCSLMVTEEAFPEAVRLARENPGLAVGLHLVTVQGKAVLHASEIPLLVDREGHFPNSPTSAGLKYYFSRMARQQLAKELAAQFARFEATGLRLSHVDSHLHMHVHPVIFSLALELAEKYGTRRMRLPRDDFWLAVRYQNAEWLRTGIAALIFAMLTRRMRKRLLRHGFSFSERVYGHFPSGGLTLEDVLLILDHLAGNANEIYFHPEVADAAAGGGCDRLQRNGDLGILTSSVLQERLQRSGIALINYFGLTARQ